MKTKKNSSKEEARKLIASASKTKLTLAGDAAMRYIIMFVGLVLAEIEVAKKRLYGISCQYLINASLDYIRMEKGDTVYTSDRALLSDYYHTVRDYVWSIVNRTEAEYIIKHLKLSEVFCYKFFYGMSIMADSINMGPIVSKLVNELRTTYHIAIDERDVASIIYISFWDEGRWSKLDSFRFESSFFCWLETISRREVIKHLEKQGYIKVQKEKTSGSMRVNLLSQDPARCKMIIEDEISTKKDRQLLLYIYFNRYDEAKIKDLMRMDDEQYKCASKKAVTKLKEAMLRSTQSYDDILRHKDPRDITVSADAAMEIIGWLEYKTGESSLLDIFGLNLSDSEIQDYAQDVISTVSAGIPWKERDRYIFYGRYFEDADPVEMAKELGVSRGYIDTRFSRLQERFNKALRQWAVDMRLLTKEDVVSIERRIRERKERERAMRAEKKALREARRKNKHQL